MPLDRHQLTTLLAQQKAGEPLRLPPPKPRKKRDNTEWRTQAALFKWWRAAAAGFGVDPRLMFHIPNGSLLGGVKAERERRGVWMKMAGCVGGVPDILLCVPSNAKWPNPSPVHVAVTYYAALFIEMKAPKGEPSDEQLAIHELLRQRGYAVAIVRSLEEGIAVITDYLR